MNAGAKGSVAVIDAETRAASADLPAPARPRSAPALSYLFAVAAPLLAFALLWLLSPVFGQHYSFFLPLLAVISVAWYGGYWPAVLALAVDVVIFLALPDPPPTPPSDLHQPVAITLFVFSGLCCALLGESQLVARERSLRALANLREKALTLEEEVARRRAAESELQLTLHRFRSLTEAVPQLVWTADAAGQLTFVNQRWAPHTGLSIDALLGRGLTATAHPEDAPALDASWRRALQERPDRFAFEYRLRRADGPPTWAEAIAVPLRDERGTVVQWVGTLTDIHEKKLEAEQLETLVHQRTLEVLRANDALREEVAQRARAQERELAVSAELRRSNEELEKFAYVASHDLQEPLRKIQAFGDRLARKCGDAVGDQGREYLDRMLASAARMRKLIDDLLSFSRVGSRPPALVPVDLNAALQSVVSDLEVAFEHAGASLDAGPLPTVLADPAQLRQLLQNLLANSLKFRRPDVPPHIVVRAGGPEAGRYRLTFADNGIGFEPAYADRIFEVFQRLHGRAEYEGTGIGLAICRKIVERHGGTIRARGRPGEGATFVFDLPAPPPATTEEKDSTS